MSIVQSEKACASKKRLANCLISADFREHGFFKPKEKIYSTISEK